MRIFFFIFFLLIAIISKAQFLGLDKDEWLRRQQLLGEYSANTSFMVRPVAKQDSTNKVLEILPIQFNTKFNSHHPYGWNDQGMIMAKGLQAMFSAGILAKYGPIEIQLQPEYYYAANPNYATTAGYGSAAGKSFSKLYGGQSAIKLNLGPITLGASTQNLWWGPGQFSSLMMSNNAPGFLHYTFNTNKPIQTPIGSFEWQLVIGKLNEDTTKAFENSFLKPFNPRNEDRFFNGVVITYQPKFLPNIFLGVTRSEHLYTSDRNKRTGLSKYVPVLLGASPEANASTASIPSDGAFSFFGRWILPKNKAEFYIEWGYNDFKQNFRDLAVNPSHAAALIAGFKKIVPIKNNQLLDISGEITQMAQTPSYILRNAGNWYVHGGVSQGFTYQNQIMGAGSGFGNNVQTLQVKKINGQEYIGIKLQRIQQDPKGLGGPTSNLLMRPIQWNDVAIGFLAQKKFNDFWLTGEIQFVNSTNYGWEKGNAFNLFATINARYILPKRGGKP